MRDGVRQALSRYGAQAGLVGVAAVWGTTFVVVAEAIGRYPVFGFLFWRFLVGAAAFAVLFPRVFRRLHRRDIALGTGAGVLLAAGYVFQTFGLAPRIGTTPAKAALITGLYVVVVPLLQAIVLRRRPTSANIVGAGVALLGMWLLSGVGLGGHWSGGDSLVLGCAIAYSLHMIVLGSTREHHDTAALVFVQLVVVCALTGGLSLALERPGLPGDAVVWGAIALTGVFASAGAFGIQTWAQRRIPPARAALVLVTEPAFGGLTGWIVSGVFAPLEVAGAVLMVSGMLVSEVSASRAKEPVVIEPAVEGIPVPRQQAQENYEDSVDRP